MDSILDVCHDIETHYHIWDNGMGEQEEVDYNKNIIGQIATSDMHLHNIRNKIVPHDPRPRHSPSSCGDSCEKGMPASVKNRSREITSDGRKKK